MPMKPQGWYRDPYCVHKDRYCGSDLHRADDPSLHD